MAAVSGWQEALQARRDPSRPLMKWLSSCSSTTTQVYPSDSEHASQEAEEPASEHSEALKRPATSSSSSNDQPKVHWYVKHKKQAYCIYENDGQEVPSCSRDADADSGMAIFTWPDGHSWLSSEPALSALEPKTTHKKPATSSASHKSSPLKLATLCWN